VSTMPPGTYFCRRCTLQIKGASVYVDRDGPFCDSCAEIVVHEGTKPSPGSNWRRWLWGLLGIK
jgi:hypothetical protein